MIKKNENVATILLIEGALSLLIGLGFGLAVLLADRHEHAGKLVILSVVFIFAGIVFLAYRFYSFDWPERQEVLKSQTAQRLREQMKEYDGNLASAPTSTMLNFRDNASTYRRMWVSVSGAVLVVLFLMVVTWRGLRSGDTDAERKTGKIASSVSSAPMTLSKPPGMQRDDSAWQKEFEFPGSNKRLEGNKLTIAFPSPVVDSGVKITLDGEFYLNQLAALANVRWPRRPIDSDKIHHRG